LELRHPTQRLRSLQVPWLTVVICHHLSEEMAVSVLQLVGLHSRLPTVLRAAATGRDLQVAVMEQETTDLLRHPITQAVLHILQHLRLTHQHHLHIPQLRQRIRRHLQRILQPLPLIHQPPLPIPLLRPPIPPRLRHIHQLRPRILPRRPPTARPRQLTLQHHQPTHQHHLPTRRRPRRIPRRPPPTRLHPRHTRRHLQPTALRLLHTVPTQMIRRMIK
jgi:hypothetical protein